MENLESKLKNEKPAYKLKLKDFIPVCGLLNHAKRSGHAKTSEKSYERFIASLPRGLLLSIYNGSILYGLYQLYKNL